MLEISDREFSIFKKLVLKLLGIHLSEHKKTLVITRLSSRIEALGLKTLMEYLHFIDNSERGDDELSYLVNKITTNTTSFYREKHHFDFLQNELFPTYIKRGEKTGERSLRIWSAACSTGEEPYSIAMTVYQSFMNLIGWDIKILATDVNSEVLNFARRGVYPREKIKEEVTPVVMTRCFTDLGHSNMAVRHELKRLIMFKRLNFLERYFPIESKLDIVFCRNAMIYFSSEVREELLWKFYNLLKDDGCLFVGHSESLLASSDKFEIINSTIYRKVL